jgi:hypothetical protein
MKKDTLFKHKKVVITCEENMGDANECWKLLEPPAKHEKVSKGRKTNVICGQCNKPGHSKEHCHWNPDNSSNKLKDKNEVVVNGVSIQPNGTRIKFNNKGGRKEANKYNSIIYCCFIYNFVEHKIYDYPHKDAIQDMFREKATTTTPKEDDVVVNMVLAITTHS